MKEKKHYISIKPKGSNAYHQNGKRLKISERIVNIGEMADCDVRYESNGLQPDYYASIIQNEDGKEWRIVKRSQHVDVSILGKGSIGYACQLADGDLISFDHQPMVLCFHKHFDDQYDNQKNEDFWQWAIIGLLGLITFIAFALNLNRKESICAADIEPLEESVYLLKVDSVCRWKSRLGQKDQIRPTKVLLSEVPTGTAFLTDGGKLVTARHCVEYWIGENLDLTTKVSEMSDENIVRWAIETETYNQTWLPDSAMQLEVYFSLYDFMGNKKYSFSSADERVHIKTERDGVFMLADFNHDYYWRSIRPYFVDRQMELGDILWIDSIPERGSIHLASKEEMEQVKNGTNLMICGYPMTGIGDKRMTFTEGTIRRHASEVENLFFESNINHGFSGGPVLMKSGSDVVAIGVVSRVDSISSGLYKWAVPVSEMINER